MEVHLQFTRCKSTFFMITFPFRSLKIGYTPEISRNGNLRGENHEHPFELGGVPLDFQAPDPMIQSIIQGSKAGTIKSCRERQTCEWFSPKLGFSPAKMDDFTTKIGIQQLIEGLNRGLKIWVCPQIRDRPLIPGISMVMGRRWILGHRYEHHGLISSFCSTTSQAEIVFFSGVVVFFVQEILKSFQ